MRRRLVYLFSALLLNLVMLQIGFAKDIYVTDIMNITMRTGPGVQYKIVAILKSGTKLEMVEFQKDWSQVQTGQGKVGWVLSRFLTEKEPDSLMVDELRKKNKNLIRKLTALEEENKTLIVKNAALVQIKEKYNKLKQQQAFSEFLKMDAKYKKMQQEFNVQKTQIHQLENDLNNESKLWFLIGPGVFIVGLIFGLSTRKKRKSRLL